MKINNHNSYLVRIIVVFAFAFITNAIWENVHVYLYTNYRGGAITEFILLRASFWDAVIICVLVVPFLFVPFLRNKPWFIFAIGIAIAVLIEWYALGTNRWAYNSWMPIVPFLNTGASPTFQLGLLGYLTFYFQKYIFSDNHS